MKTQKISATLAILTPNSAATLTRALESAKDFSDIIICDGGSTDGTLDIAGKYGARILEQDKKFLNASGRLFDYAGARNQCLDASRENWFFFLDSDEYCGEDLIATIRSTVTERQEGAFWIERRYVRHGVVIDCATTYPNRQMRFFSKRSAEHFVKKMDERILLKDGVSAEILPGTLYVPFDMDISELRRKWDHQVAVDVAQRGSLTLWEFAGLTFGFAKVSLLYFLRLMRIMLFCHGTRMPFAFEMERHRLHLRLIAAFWQIVAF